MGFIFTFLFGFFPLEGLFPIASLQGNGLMNSKIAPTLCEITKTNQVVEINLSNEFGAEIYNTCIYRSGYVCLYTCVFHPYSDNKQYSVIRYIGSHDSRTKIYISDKKICFVFTGLNSAWVTVNPTSLYNKIQSINVIPSSSFNPSGMKEVIPLSMNK